ncbi:tRNA (N6-threonylcarbamoyladenosine(37)-N6)-methyltransferase TrmO [Thiosulfativibrio zosterae]|uniref:tRNA (N6-threonylcarbamoyladenosine(37)-N6)-methyltransferase TrmO n=1 Tax=Thiosulfativibrio zosterae TaxID=2675053 RepID=A0A6F8PMI4_9GAMM|nr:tRNA (N6-threonylcarbamoyladenosine(37)-N6)-methyltransferase TrmO [Thiosulfativibrio zosterae]BBP43257.1 tRNA (N6-threonylcarbamoyladenosine(37)-N6)-methyltransferase TrmO [Thiosulfativibrio zosterae]
MNQPLPFACHQIGLVHSPFKEKFGIPRQTGLIKGNLGKIELLAPWNREEALNGLEGFSHIWVIFIFHEAIKPLEDWRPTVRPPREGAKRQGVFATRSPYRPNPIGMSVLQYHGWEKSNGKLFLKVSGLDLLDMTPVIDIKPYLPYADQVPQALGGFAHEAPASNLLPVSFSELARQQLLEVQERYPELQALIESTLSHNPRPIHFGNIDQRNDFGVKLYEFNIQYQICDTQIWVVSLFKNSAN